MADTRNACPRCYAGRREVFIDTGAAVFECELCQGTGVQPPSAPYRYEPHALTPPRRTAIRALIEGLYDEAAQDIGHTRAIYEALVDLMNVTSPRF